MANFRSLFHCAVSLLILSIGSLQVQLEGTTVSCSSHENQTESALLFFRTEEQEDSPAWKNVDCGLDLCNISSNRSSGFTGDNTSYIFLCFGHHLNRSVTSQPFKVSSGQKVALCKG